MPPAPLLASLSQYLAVHMGLHLPPERWADLARALTAAAKEFGFTDAQSCGEWLLGAPLGRRQIEVLAGKLSVGETYFFREKAAFDILQREILPELIHARRGGDQRLRIWSAGCCTGEEPYSIAMVLRQALPDLAQWNVTLLATDIAPRFLRKAEDGNYSEWSFRGMPKGLRDRFFRKTAPGRWQIAPEIRNMVSFGYLNLAEDVYPSLLNDTNAMDVIFCRNVLIYFTPEAAGRTIAGFHHSLVDGGWLVVSPSEVPLVHEPLFTTVSFTGAIVHRKEQQFPEESLQPDLPRPATPDTKPIPTTPLKQATALYEQGRYDEAVETLLNSTADKTDPHTCMLLARAYANQGKLADGLAACEQAIRADKLHAGHHYLRASILQEQGATAEARFALHRTLYLAPGFVLAHFALGNLARARGADAQARKHFSNALLLLHSLPADHTLPESDGLTVGRLTAIITALLERKPAS